MRLIDFLKAQQITSLFTSLTQEGSALQQSEIAISSLMDSWLLLQNIESDGERNRGLYVLKSRGMAHSNQIREFVMSQQGVDLVDAYIGPGGLLVGAARAAQSAREKAAALASQQEGMRLRSTLERKHTAVERQIAALRSEYEAEEQEAQRADEQAVTRTHVLTTDRAEQGRLRQADAKRAVSAREHTKRSERKR
jgi:circadian clock protein KaiC